MPQLTQTQETVAVLGVGTMGHGMAASALRAGLPTVVWDRTPERSHALTGLGAQVANTAGDAAGRAGIVVTMLPDADAVMSIGMDQGMLDALSPDAIWVQMSTIGVAGIDRVAALVTTRRSRSRPAATSRSRVYGNARPCPVTPIPGPRGCESLPSDEPTGPISEGSGADVAHPATTFPNASRRREGPQSTWSPPDPQRVPSARSFGIGE